jgi:hypothetical protein
MPIKTEKSVKKEIINLTENREINNLLMNNFDKFSVEALMMKQENFPGFTGALTQENATTLTDMNNGDVTFAQLGLQQTFQNLKNLFVNYSMNNVSN